MASDPVSLGKSLNAVTVQDADGKAVRFELQGAVTAVIFTSTKCPISNDYNDRMSAVFRDYGAKGVRFVYVNANSNEPASEVAEHTRAAEFPFAVYKDPGNLLADQLGATVTPEVYVFDNAGVLRYHGQVDDSRNPARVKAHTLRAALDELLAGKSVTRAETKAFGCTIKRVKKVS
jgi:protein-disulfide isomerase